MLLDQQLVRSAGLRDNLPDLNNSESCCLGLFLLVLFFYCLKRVITKQTLLKIETFIILEKSQAVMEKFTYE